MLASWRSRAGGGTAGMLPRATPPSPAASLSRTTITRRHHHASLIIAGASASASPASPPPAALSTTTKTKTRHPYCHHRLRRHRRHPVPPPAATTPNNDANNAANNDAGARAYGNLFNARIFADPERQAEFERCMTDLRQLSTMSSKFPDMDVAGKRYFLEAMESASERYRIFIKRLELSKATDQAAREYLEYTGAQMAQGGFSIVAMFEGLAQSLDRYKEIVDAEERATAAGPAEAGRFREALRAEWGQSALGAIDMKQLAEMVSPEVIAAAQADPQFYVAIKEISESPTPDVLARWISHDKIGPLVTAMSKLLLQKRGLGGVGGGSG